MSIPEYQSLIMAENDGLLCQAAIGKLFNRHRSVVHNWVKRRQRSGFPAATGVYREGSRVFALYDKAAVVRWFDNYEPHKAKGGAPVGNRNWRGRLKTSS